MKIACNGSYNNSSPINHEVIEMRESRELKLDEVLNELYHLRDENEFLKKQIGAHV